MKNTNLKINKLNKYIVFIISFTFLYLFYLCIPSLYKKENLQKELTNQLVADFNLKINIPLNLKYSIFPKPNYLIKNMTIFNDDIVNPKKIIEIKEMRLFVSQKYFFSQKQLKIINVTFKESNIFVRKDELTFFKNFLNTKLLQKKIIIKKSYFFYNNKNNKVISIFPISKLNISYNKKNDQNKIIGEGLFFNIPFNLLWIKNFKEDLDSMFILKANNLKLFIKNVFIVKENSNIIYNNLNIGNLNLNTNLEIKDSFVKIESKNSKIKNNKIYYNGVINFNPFNLDLDINLKSVNINNFLIEKNNILNELLILDQFYNDNLSAQISLNIDKFLNNKLINYGKIYFNFSNGVINLNESYFSNKKIGDIVLNKSSLLKIDEEAIFKGKFEFTVKNLNQFYKLFQIPKNTRKPFNRFLFEIDLNVSQNKFEIYNLKFFNNKNESTIKLISHSDDIKNWIELKRFINRVFRNYLG